MKTIILISLAVLTASAAWAQPPHKDGPRKEGMRERFGGDADRRAGMMKQGMDRWLEQLKQSDPAEYEELTRLRKENPREFYANIRDRLRAKRQQMLDQFPGIKEAVNQLSPDQRETLFSLFAHMGHRGGGMDQGPRRGGPRPEDPEFVRMKSEFVGTQDEERRNAIRTELKRRLSAVFDQRLRQREAQVDLIELQLKKLRGSMYEQQQQREKILEQRLQELLGG